MAEEGRQLFLSKRIVTENNIIDGGVLVNDGSIVKIIRRDEVEKLLAENDGKIKVSLLLGLNIIYSR
jgi:alpha-D-ribose 1-methylphosphonate 5-triphosphate diphosphatase PhnM